MKKTSYLALLLAVLMALSIFTGCDSKESAAGNLTPVVVDPTDDLAAAGDLTPAEKDPTDAPTEASTEAPAEPETESTVSLGRMEGGIYTNAYTGYGCTLDSNWAFYTAEELQELPENTQELFSDSELGEATSGYTQITDMMAENAEDLTVINVVYTQIPFAERLLYTSMSEEAIVDSTLAQKDLLVDGYAQAGIMVSSMEKTTVTFLGQERIAIKTVATIEGLDYYILQIQDFKLGSYGVSLTLSSFLEDNTENLLDLFYSVE